MVYAAPIVKSAWSCVISVLIPIAPDPFLTPVIQIPVSDYQGIALLDSVVTTFYYAKQGDTELRKVSIIMQAMKHDKKIMVLCQELRIYPGISIYGSNEKRCC